MTNILAVDQWKHSNSAAIHDYQKLTYRHLVLSHVFEVTPQSFVRMNNLSKYGPKAMKYNRYKEQLVLDLIAKHGQLVIPSDAKRCPDAYYHLSLFIHGANKRCDFDNLAKPVADALQSARIIFNDSHIKSASILVADRDPDREPGITVELFCNQSKRFIGEGMI